MGWVPKIWNRDPRTGNLSISYPKSIQVCTVNPFTKKLIRLNRLPMQDIFQLIFVTSSTQIPTHDEFEQMIQTEADQSTPVPSLYQISSMSSILLFGIKGTVFGILKGACQWVATVFPWPKANNEISTYRNPYPELETESNDHDDVNKTVAEELKDDDPSLVTRTSLLLNDLKKGSSNKFTSIKKNWIKWRNTKWFKGIRFVLEMIFWIVTIAGIGLTLGGIRRDVTEIKASFGIAMMIFWRDLLDRMIRYMDWKPKPPVDLLPPAAPISTHEEIAATGE